MFQNWKGALESTKRMLSGFMTSSVKPSKEALPKEAKNSSSRSAKNRAINESPAINELQGFFILY